MKIRASLRCQRKPKTQIFAENHRFSQVHPFSWKFKHLEGTGNCRKPQIFAGNRRSSQKTAGNRRLGSVTLGASPLARPQKMLMTLAKQSNRMWEVVRRQFRRDQLVGAKPPLCSPQGSRLGPLAVSAEWFLRDKFLWNKLLRHFA